MRGARAQKCTIDGTTFDSIAEACYYCWCREAKALGVIREFWLQPKFELTQPAKYTVTKQLKTKTKEVERTLLQGSEYTADFGVMVHCTNTLGLLEGQYHSESDVVYTIDVKGAHQPPGSAAKFSLTQKMLWHTQRVYANRVVIAYDTKKYSDKKCQSGFFASNGVPEQLPPECYQRCGTKLYAVWSRMFTGLPTIREALE